MQQPSVHYFVSLPSFASVCVQFCFPFINVAVKQKAVLSLIYIIFRAKITDLATEISRMQKEVDQFNQENATFLTYEKQFVHDYSILDLQTHLVINQIIIKITCNTLRYIIMYQYLV